MYAEIYNEMGENLASNDDFGDSMDFIIWYEFVAGGTYYFEINTFYDNSDVEFSFVDAVHTADDGSEHPLVYTDEECGTCEDYDGDDICDYCGEPMYEDEDTTDDTCEDCGMVHINFFSEIICFFTRIINFIKNLFA